MKSIIKYPILSQLLLLCIISSAFFLNPANGQQKQVQSADDDDALLRAMSDELARSVDHLQLGNLDKPYFIDYTVQDTETYGVSATFGALVRFDHTRNRTLQTHVRVGSYDFDNSDFYGNQSDVFGQASLPVSLVVDNNYNALRRDIWLATDTAYKQVTEQLSRKRAFVSSRIEDDKAPDFSHEEPVTQIMPRQSLLFDQRHWETQVRQWSAIFREFPAIQDSNVIMRAQVVNKYITTSEGTEVRQPSVLIGLEARATTQAKDGGRLSQAVPFYATSTNGLPPLPEITRQIRRMAEELTALRDAPVLDANYVGPVLFTGQASAEMFAQLLAPQLSGQRPPLADPQLAGILGESKNELSDRLNRPVLPSFLSIFDDPTQKTSEGQELIGSYQIDDEGVTARRVSLIENGVLKNLLMGRRPRRNLLRSNGHGRAGFVGEASAQAGNLFIRASEGKTDAELKAELIKLCKTQNQPYGITIKALSNISGGTAVRRGQASFSAPLLTYKVYAQDGREELVRGVNTGAVSVRALKDIVAAGREVFVDNRLASNSSLPFGSASIPMSVIAPSVLVEEIELKRMNGAQQKPALLSNPFFSK